MIWKKRGLFFNPIGNKLSKNIAEFAQSPQTLVFDNFIRVYFSTRTRDESGQYLSNIAYIDVDLNFEKIIGFSDHQVIKLGELGTFDEHGIFPINPFKDEDKFYAFTCGWNRRMSVPVETGIGLCISNDYGKTYTRLGKGPVLSPSPLEPVLVGDGFVLKNNGVYHMWYIFGTKWMPKSNEEPVTRVYKIGYATSLDLINWNKTDGKQIIANVLNDDECQALPSVIKIKDTYHMYFCFREATDFRKNHERGYRLGYAYSYDLINWTRDDAKGGIYKSELKSDWDSDMLCYPHIFEVNNKIFLLYNGNEFGKFGFGVAELISTE